MRISNFTDNDDVKVVSQLGHLKVIEWKRDLSVSLPWAQPAWFASQMGVRKRQLVCELDGSVGLAVQAGAMQWTAGNVNATTGIKGVGDFLTKVARGAVTDEGAIKPEYQGTGTIVLEPTYRHILLVDLEEAGGALTVNDGLFYACESTVRQRAVMVKRPSAVVAGNEGLFNLSLEGTGAVALESPVAEEELVTVELDEGEELKVDGNFAIAWSTSLDFRVERSGKTLAGSAVSGEGLVNAYRTVGGAPGKVILAPVAYNRANPNAGSSVGINNR